MHEHMIEKSSVSLSRNCDIGFLGLLSPKPAVPGCGGRISTSEIRSNDVITCIRGHYSNTNSYHQGNFQFLNIIGQCKKTSFSDDSNESAEKANRVVDIAARVVDIVRSLDPPGRFLMKNEKSGYWEEIGDEKARRKAAQALGDYVSVDRAREEKGVTLTLPTAQGQRLLETAKSPHSKGLGDETNHPKASCDLLPQRLRSVQPIHSQKESASHCSSEDSLPIFEDFRIPQTFTKFQGFIPEPDVFPGDEGLIAFSETTSNDVLSGRGNWINNYLGNVQFRYIVAQHRAKYHDTSNKRIEKSFVAARVVAIVRCMIPPGRFLKKDEKTGYWEEIGDDNAREKATQALREFSSVDRTEKKRKEPLRLPSTETGKSSQIVKTASCEVQATINALIMLSRAL